MTQQSILVVDDEPPMRKLLCSNLKASGYTIRSAADRTRLLFTVVYDGDFKPYIQDLIDQVAPWMDLIFLGVVDGCKGFKDRGFLDCLIKSVIEADFFYIGNPDSPSFEPALQTAIEDIKRYISRPLETAGGHRPSNSSPSTLLTRCICATSRILAQIDS